jgi:hypothetical protein
MAPFATECRELVHDNHARARSQRRDPHEVEQNPCAELCRQVGIRRGVQAEQHGSTRSQSILQRQPGPEALRRRTLEHQPEPRSKAGDALMLGRAESTDLCGESFRLGHTAEAAQQFQQNLRVQVAKNHFWCALDGCDVQRLEHPEQIALRRGAIHVRVA